MLAATLLVAFSTASFAKDKNADHKLLNQLSSTFKTSQQIHWTSKGEYSQAAFNFKNTTAYAYYATDNNELIGFGILFNKTDMPEVVTNAIKAKYNEWEVVDAMIFIDPNGYLNYFVQIHKGDKALALRITPAGKSSVYAKVAFGK